MYKISKFESFSDNTNITNIENIKDIFRDLIDKWDMVENSKDSKDIRYKLFNNLNTVNDDIREYHRNVNIGKHIKNIKNVYLIIHCDLSGPNDFYTTLHEFNEDCENLLKRFQSEFNCELLTAYGNPGLRPYGIVTSRFVFVFRN
jgi:hypothetical protein